MTWVLCILVPMVHTPRGRSGATFVKALAQSECGQFCHFGICGPNLDCHHAKWHGDLWGPSAWESPLYSRWIAHGMADPISKPAWRYTEAVWGASPIPAAQPVALFARLAQEFSCWCYGILISVGFL